MPGVTGLDLTAWLTRHQPDVRVVILSMHSSSDYVLEAFQAGARAYLLKHSAPAELALALRAIQAGDTFLSPGVSAHMAQAYLRGAPAAGSEAGRLTPRQRQVLKLLAGGKSTKQIAAILGLSPRTVETHRADLMERLGAKDAMSLLREAAKLGLVDVADPL
jgi:DNA-binding NarL/FixJ family response regulator